MKPHTGGKRWSHFPSWSSVYMDGKEFISSLHKGDPPFIDYLNGPDAEYIIQDTLIIICDAPVTLLNHVEVAKILLSFDGSNPDSYFFEPTGCLYRAIVNNRVGLVKLFLDRGAQVEASIGEGYPCLFHAIENQHVEMVELLLNRGSNPFFYHSGVDRLTITPLYHAIMKNDANPKIIQLILDRMEVENLASDPGYDPYNQTLCLCGPNFSGEKARVLCKALSEYIGFMDANTRYVRELNIDESIHQIIERNRRIRKRIREVVLLIIGARQFRGVWREVPRDVVLIIAKLVWKSRVDKEWLRLE